MLCRSRSLSGLSLRSSLFFSHDRAFSSDAPPDRDGVVRILVALVRRLIIQRGFEVDFWGALARASVRGGVIRTRRVTVLVVVVVLVVGATRVSRGRIAHHLVFSFIHPTRARQSSRKNSKKKHAQKNDDDSLMVHVSVRRRRRVGW